MLTKPVREHDDRYWKQWIREQPEWACLLSGTSGETLDACHLKSRKAGGSDYWVFPLIHEFHMQIDHAPRGAQHKWRESQLRDELALWFYPLPVIHRRYYLEQTEDRQQELMEFVTFQMAAGKSNG